MSLPPQLSSSLHCRPCDFEEELRIPEQAYQSDQSLPGKPGLALPHSPAYGCPWPGACSSPQLPVTFQSPSAFSPLFTLEELSPLLAGCTASEIPTCGRGRNPQAIAALPRESVLSDNFPCHCPHSPPHSPLQSHRRAGNDSTKPRTHTPFPFAFPDHSPPSRTTSPTPPPTY